MRIRLIQCSIAAFALISAFAANPRPRTPDLKISVVRVHENEGVMIRFENHSQKPIHLLGPLDGSEWGWHMPVYDLRIMDFSGRLLPREGRCGLSGLYANTNWPDDYPMSIFPEESRELFIHFTQRIPTTDNYSVSISYRFDSAGRTVKPRVVKYPDNLWAGTVSSPPTLLQIARRL